MDDRKPPISSHDVSGHICADVAPTAPGARRFPDQVEQLPASPLREGSVVYCGNVRQVSEGFAIALRATGVGADILPATSSNREDR
jgi:hypothetical protein